MYSTLVVYVETDFAFICLTIISLHTHTHTHTHTHFSKLQAQFQSMEVRNSCFSAFVDFFTPNTYVMVIMSDPTIRELYNNTCTFFMCCYYAHWQQVLQVGVLVGLFSGCLIVCFVVARLFVWVGWLGVFSFLFSLPSSWCAMHLYVHVHVYTCMLLVNITSCFTYNVYTHNIKYFAVVQYLSLLLTLTFF